jgi:hypothetical protein
VGWPLLGGTGNFYIKFQMSAIAAKQKSAGYPVPDIIKAKV